MRTYLLVLTVLIGFMVGSPIWATSLFTEDGCDLFTADRANEIGDLVTIVVSETTSATDRAATQTSKKLNTDGQISVSGFLEWIAGLPDVIQPIKDLTFTPTESFAGAGTVTASGTFTTRVTGTVVDILPNGNLVVEVSRDIKVAESTGTLGLRGVIRPQDITVDNTIASTLMADMEIIYQGEGIIADRQRDGILSRIFNFFF
jgi:flagellar L-ring protein precursor FlgH